MTKNKYPEIRKKAGTAILHIPSDKRILSAYAKPLLATIGLYSGSSICECNRTLRHANGKRSHLITRESVLFKNDIVVLYQREFLVNEDNHVVIVLKNRFIHADPHV